MMIRKGTEADLDGVNEGYEELLRHEKLHPSVIFITNAWYLA